MCSIVNFNMFYLRKNLSLPASQWHLLAFKFCGMH